MHEGSSDLHQESYCEMKKLIVCIGPYREVTISMANKRVKKDGKKIRVPHLMQGPLFEASDGIIIIISEYVHLF